MALQQPAGGHALRSIAQPHLSCGGCCLILTDRWQSQCHMALVGEDMQALSFA